MKSLKTLLGIALATAGLGGAIAVGAVSTQSKQKVEIAEATNTSGGTFYLDDSSATWWSGSNAKLSLNFFGGTGSTQAFSGFATAVSGESHVFKFTIPNGAGTNGYTTVIGVRQNSSETTPSWTNVWNQTVDVTIGNNNCIKVLDEKTGTKNKANSIYYVDKISLLGSFEGGDWSTGITMTINKSTKIATTPSTLTIKKNDTFKMRANDEWVSQWGHSCKVSSTFANNCFAADDDGNFKALHDCTLNISLNYSTGQVTLTGEQAAQDSEDIHVIHRYTESTGSWDDPVVSLKQGSSTEYTGQFTFGIGDKFKFNIANNWYGYLNVKATNTLKGEHEYFYEDNDHNILVNVAGTYTIYMETQSGDNFGIWLQKDSVDGIANSKEYAKQFNTAILGICDPNGTNTNVSNLNTEWTNQATLFGNQVDEVQAYLKAATGSNGDSDIATFILKYTSVYTLRGNSLTSGDFLQKGITPIGSNVIEQISTTSNTSATILIMIACIAVSATGMFILFKKKKHN